MAGSLIPPTEQPRPLLLMAACLSVEDGSQDCLAGLGEGEAAAGVFSYPRILCSIWTHICEASVFPINTRIR